MIRREAIGKRIVAIEQEMLNPRRYGRRLIANVTAIVLEDGTRLACCICATDRKVEAQDRGEPPKSVMCQVEIDPRPCEFDGAGICQPLWHQFSVDKVHTSIDPPKQGGYWSRLMRGTVVAEPWEYIQP